MASILPFDELNTFKNGVVLQLSAEKREETAKSRAKNVKEDIIDEMFDLFLLAYARAVEVTNTNLSSDYKPTLDEIMSVVDAKVAGKTWRERVDDYFSKAQAGEIPLSKGESSAEQETGKQEVDKGQTNLPDALVRIAETETHRIANTAALGAAKQAGARFKTWATMLDDRVRETHDYLEGETVEIGEDFYTFDGDHASAPGLFELAENNVNCRCELLFS